MNLLEQLRSMTTIVADTGEIDEIRKYQPVDAHHQSFFAS